MAAAPLITVLMLRDLGFAPWQYGLALGLPGIGGIIGSLTVTPLTRHLHLSRRTVLLAFGVARTLWLGLIPLAPPGPDGLTVIIVADTCCCSAPACSTRPSSPTGWPPPPTPT
jgi:predicted MFS family arabinose efflux permease